MTKRLAFLLAAATAGALVLAVASAAGQSTMDSKKPGAGADTKFVMDTAKGGLAEVEMGRLAADKASNPDVKKFGQRMVDDHSKANDELKAIASGKGITVPSDLDAADKRQKDQWSKMSGAAFDKAYMADMVKDHKKDVAEFKKEAASGKDPDVKAFAGKTLPTLEDHLKMAEETYAKVK
jgi:putative membrane protein